jgi:hypothetical protein
MSHAEPAKSNACLSSAAPRLDPWMRAAMIGWISLATAASIKTIIEPQAHTVYTTFSQAARDWWGGNSLYIGREFFYGPSFAVAMSPFAIWPDWLGGVFWNLTSCGLLFYSLRIFYREVLPAGSWPKRAEGQFLLLVLIGTVRSVWSGQSNALLVAMVLLAAVEIVRGRWWRAALWLAAPIHIKVWPVVAGGLFAAQSPRRLAARLALCLVLWGMIPFLTQSPATVIGQYGGWYHSLADRQTGGGRYAGYRDAWTIWEQIRHPVDARAYLAVQLIAGMTILGWCLWQRHRGLPLRQLAIYTIAAWSIWQLLFGPGTERLTYNLIAPALAWGVLTCVCSGRQRVWITVAFVATYLSSVGGFERFAAAWWPAATALEPVGVLIFATWLVRHAARTETWPDSARHQFPFAEATEISIHDREAA